MPRAAAASSSGQPGEEAELDQLGAAARSGGPVRCSASSMATSSSSEAWSATSESVEIDALPTAAPLLPALVAGRGSTRMRRMASAAAAKKWPRPSQCRASLVPDQPEVGLVDQGGGLERLAGLLLGQLLGRQLPQLVVDQRQELLGRLRVALLDGREDAGHVRHRQARRQAARALSPDCVRATVPGEGSPGPGSAPRRLASRLSLARRQG